MKRKVLAIFSVFLSVVLISPNVSAFGLSSDSEIDQNGIAAMSGSGTLDLEPVESMPADDTILETQDSSEVTIMESAEPTILPSDESIATETSQEASELPAVTETTINKETENLSPPSAKESEEDIPEEQPHPDDALVSQYAYLDLKVPGRQARSATSMRPYDILADVASKSEIKDSKILQIGNAINYDASLVKAYFPMAETITFEKIENNYFVTYITASEDQIVLGYYDTGIIHKSVDLKSESNLIYIDENGGMVYPDSYFKSEPLSPELDEEVKQAIMNNDIDKLKSIPEIAVYEEGDILIIDSTISQAEATSAYMSEEKSNQKAIEKQLLDDDNFKPYTDKLLGYNTYNVNGKNIILVAFESRNNYRFYIDDKTDIEPDTPLEIAVNIAINAGLIIAGLSSNPTVAAIAFFADVFLAVFELYDNYGYLLKDPMTIVTRSSCFYDFERPIYYHAVITTDITWNLNGVRNFRINPNESIKNNFVYVKNPDPEAKTIMSTYAQRFIDGEYKLVKVDTEIVVGSIWAEQPGLFETMSYSDHLLSYKYKAAELSDNDLIDFWVTSPYGFSPEIDKRINTYLTSTGVSIDLRDSDVGGTPKTATAIAPDLLYTSNIDYYGDKDLYKFVVPENNGNLNSLYHIETTGEMNLTGGLYRTNFSGTSLTLAAALHPGSEKNINKDVTLAPGIYVIEVYKWVGDFVEPTPYNIKVSLVSQDKVSNDWQKLNVELTENVAYEENLDYDGDKDMYKFVVPENNGNLNSLYHIETTGEMSMGGQMFKLNLLGTSFKQAAALSPWPEININKDVILEPGVYFIEVYRYGQPFVKPTPYTIKVSLVSQDKVSNDWLKLNVELTENVAFEENIDYDGDKDMYKFVVPEKAVYNIQTTGEMGKTGQMFKINFLGTAFEQVAALSPWPEININKDVTLEPGVYFIEVYRYGIPFVKPTPYAITVSQVS